MTAALIYLLIIVFLILWNGCFGLFNDAHLSKRKLATFFFLKALAVPVFYFVYHDYYGGLSKFDTGKFYSDAQLLNECAKKHPAEFTKVWLGISSGTSQHECLVNTQNWLSGKDGKFFFNDNRILIRLHSLLHFVAFNSWHVHALFCCFMGFAGLFWLYRACRDYLPGKETATMLLLCFLPALWFYSGALLKEGITLFTLGAGILLIRKFITGQRTWRISFLLLLVLMLGSILKPYLLLTAFICFAWFFHLQHKATIKRRSLYYIAFILLFYCFANLSFAFILGKSAGTVLTQHRRAFTGASHGGIFLAGDTTYLRLEFDTTLVTKAPGKKYRYTINRGVKYMYWNDSRNADTLYAFNNKDTVREYELAFMTPKATSNFEIPDPTLHPLWSIVCGLYYALAHPFFINAETALQMLASVENMVVLLAIGMVLYGMLRRKKSRLLSTAFMTFALSVCLMVSLSSPNSGAVFRYRAPAVIFILLAALYYYDKPVRQQVENES